MSGALVFEEAPARRRAFSLRVRPAQYALALLATFAAYYGTARLGFELAFAGPVASILWLPAGVGIAALYLGGLALWPAILAADLLVNDYGLAPVGANLVQTFGNMIEVVVTAAVLLRLARRGPLLDTVPGVLAMLAAVAGGTAVSATIATLGFTAWHLVSAAAVPTFWRTFWLGDASGALVVVPFALAWSASPIRSGWTPRRIAEAVSVAVVVGGLSEVALLSGHPILYVVFPALVWSALRLGQRGATLAIAVTVGSAVWHTVHYGGPFAYHSITRSVLEVQLYSSVVVVATLLLAAVAREREVYAEGLSSSRVRIVEAADNERRRLERNLHDGAQHRLTALAYLLRVAGEATRTTPDEARSLFERAEAEVGRAIDELRELAHGIHPAVLTDLGLGNALRSIGARSPVAVELLELPASRADATAEATAYYVVSEAVTNVQRHAHASRIRIGVTATDRGLRVRVDDDGVGGARIRPGSGLQGLVDRVEAVGGSLRIISVSGSGTRVEARIPTA